MLGFPYLVALFSVFQAKEDNIGGNMSGDGFQNGGTIIVSAGESTLMSDKMVHKVLLVCPYV